MKKFYEIYVSVRENELYCTEDYKVNVKATCIKDAIDGAVMHLYDTAQIYDKEIISIEAHKMEYIEVEEEN